MYTTKKGFFKFSFSFFGAPFLPVNTIFRDSAFFKLLSIQLARGDTLIVLFVCDDDQPFLLKTGFSAKSAAPSRYSKKIKHGTLKGCYWADTDLRHSIRTTF